MYKVMIVDDDILEVQAIEIIMKSLINDLKIMEVVKNGQEVQRVNKNLNPDIIILNDDIGGMSIEKIILSINTNVKDKILILLKGCNVKYSMNDINKDIDYCLLKPVNEDELSKALKESIINLKTNINKIKEEEFLFLESIASEDKSKCEELLEDIIEGYVLMSKNDLMTVKDNITKMIKKIIKVFYNTKIQVVEEINKNKYIEQIEYKNNLQSVVKVIKDILDLIFKYKSGETITDRLLNGKSINKNLKPIFCYIEENYKRKITLEEASSICNLNKYYFSKLFKRNTNIKFVDFITLYKIEKAKEILKYTDDCVINIAIQLGYDESGYFSKVFKKIVGVTPSVYRNENR